MEASSFWATPFTHVKFKAVNNVSGFYAMLLLAVIQTSSPCCLQGDETAFRSNCKASVYLWFDH